MRNRAAVQQMVAGVPHPFGASPVVGEGASRPTVGADVSAPAAWQAGQPRAACAGCVGMGAESGTADGHSATEGRAGPNAGEGRRDGGRPPGWRGLVSVWVGPVGRLCPLNAAVRHG